MLKITYLQIPQLRFQNVQSSDRYFFLTTNKKTPEQGKHYKGNHGKGNSISVQLHYKFFGTSQSLI